MMHSLIGRILFIISGVHFGDTLRISGIPYITIANGGSITIGNNVTLSGGINSNPLCQNNKIVLVACKDANITIGNNCGISCSIIFAQNKIEIGNNVGLSAGCRIFDTDFHSLDYKSRRTSSLDIGKAAPVIIEDDVWVAADSIILKGVRIGRGSIIAAGSIVTTDVPPFVLCGGVPARVIKKLKT